MFKLDLEKAENPEIIFPTSIGMDGSHKSKRIPENICFIDYTKTSDCVDHNKL